MSAGMERSTDARLSRKQHEATDSYDHKLATGSPQPRLHGIRRRLSDTLARRVCGQAD
jgi:hypothetical protein